MADDIANVMRANAKKGDGISVRTKRGFVEAGLGIDGLGEDPPAVPPAGISPPAYKGGSDQGRLSNEEGLRRMLKQRGLSDRDIEAQIARHRANTGLR